ncbi:ComEC/Rec2 family competence protein [Leucobacter luti]|nr:ComEC/Rec2 family competence protein [Leucobacter luti]
MLVRGVPVRLDAGSGAAFGIRIVAAAAEKSDGSLATAAADLRARLRDAAAATPGAALVPGLAVGDTSLVAAQTDRQMRDASLTHLVAVSGANCALVTSAAGWVLARCGAGRRIRILGQGAVLAGFVFVVGPDPSVQRAAVMAVVVLVSQYGGRRAIALPALASAVIVLLLRDPWQALHPGFALSVAATAGILIIAPPLTRALRLRARVPELVALPIAVACAAQFACAPLLLLLQPGLPLVGVLANVLAAPGAPLGTGLGLLALVLLPLSEPLGALAVWVAALPARWLVGTAAVTSELPYARAPWPEGWGGAALLAAAELLLGTAWWLGTHRGAHTRPRARPGLRRAGKGEADPGWRHPWSAREPALRGASRWSLGLAAAGLGLLLGPTALTPAVTRAAAPRDWSVVACDVGQGDALLLRDPARPGGVTLVDTGEDPDALLACLDRFSVGRIELLIVSHDHRDHFGALDAVIRRVDRALIAPANREDGADRALVRQLEAAGVPVTVGVAGMHGGGGVLGVAGMHGGGGGEDGGGVQWLVLGPAAGHVPADANSASVIARLRAGAVSVLLLGDTGALVQSELLRGGADLRADVLKVAHHGSRDQNRELPGRVAADLALVSVGASNRYGHPAPGTLADLAAAGTATARTDQLGSIAVSGAPGSLRVWASERGPPE